MLLRPHEVRAFIGGQIKVMDADSVFCGEIRSISLVGRGSDTKLEVQLTWKAVGQGSSVVNPQRWINTADKLSFPVWLHGFKKNIHADGRIFLANGSTKEVVSLYPPSLPTLSRDDVIGLR